MRDNSGRFVDGLAKTWCCQVLYIRYMSDQILKKGDSAKSGQDKLHLFTPRGDTRKRASLV